MDLGLHNKPIIVMAASTGLGKAAALECAREQAQLMLCSRSTEKLIQAQTDIYAATGNKPSIFAADITKYEDIKQLIAATVSTFGGVYGLIANCGGPPAGTFDTFDDEAWQQAYNLTLLSYIRTIREVLPFMRQTGTGRILCSTSSSIKMVIDNLILSNTFRNAVVGLAKSLAQELGKEGILVNVIAPGRIATDRIDHLDSIRAQQEGLPLEELQTTINNAIPLGRAGLPSEYGKLAAFLCSQANTYITGQSILIDGGLVKAL